jgi:type VI secretion system protein ImpC
VSRDPRSEVSLSADLDVQPSSLANSREREGTFRIAILGDFSARSHRDAAANPVPLARRRVWRFDRDEVDKVLAGIAPTLQLTIDPSEPPVVVRFSTMDDFHPDQLVARLPLFQQLRSLRDQADAPGRGNAPSRPAPPRAPRTESAALGLSSGSLLDRIIDNDPNASDSDQLLRGLAPQDELTEFVDRVVRPHTVREASKEQRDLTAKVDDVIAATMRVLLHHPEFQALEALWRGVEFLARRLDTSETLQIVLIDVSKAELSADLGATSDVDKTALHRLLTEGAAARSSLFVGAYTFGGDDVVLLSRLGTLGRMVGAPWLAAADPRLAGTPSFASDPDPDEWEIPLPTEWDGLRRSRDASFLSLVLPRFLLREPYGKRTDPCNFPFEEMLAGAPDHESFLWGNGGLLCALAIGESAADDEPPPTQATIDGLPLYVATIDGEAVATPCAEALITHRAVAHMVDRGLTPLASPRDGDSILISRLQSVALPPRPLSFPNRS